MQSARDLTHLQRQAITAAHDAPTHALVRTRGGFAAGPATRAATPPVFTLRLIRMLERDWLIEFDDTAFPNRATLTDKGLRIARELAATQTGKTPRAGAA